MHPAGPAPRTSTSWSDDSRRRTWLYVAIALMLALLAGLLTYQYLDDLQRKSLPTAGAVVARQSIDPGEEIAAAAVERRDVPVVVVPDSALTSVEQAVGRRARFGLEANEVVLRRDVAADEAAGLSGRLPDGRWAMVLPAGWLVSPLAEHAEGDRLDLLAYQAGQASSEAALIVQSVEIVSLPDDRAGSVTLSVSLEQAVSIVYARSNGFQVVGLLRPRGQ
jgi:Flp pilus assembly protein CpaB